MTVIEQDDPRSTGRPEHPGPSSGQPDYPGPSTARPEYTGPIPALLRPNLALPLTPALVPLLFLGVSLLLASVGVAAVVAAFVAGFWLGLLALAVVPFLVLGAIALARIGSELALAVIQVTEDVAGIAARLPRLESTVYDVANDIPRFGFLKLLTGPRVR